MIRPHNQVCWSKRFDRLVDIVDSRKLPGEERTYRIAFVPTPGGAPVVHRVPRTDLRTADKCCDGCNRWLPRGSFNGGGQVHNPIDGEVELEVCFLCKREARKYSY